MASNRIVGGKDNNHVVVDRSGRIHTLAREESALESESWDGRSFTVLAEVNLLGALPEVALFMQNKEDGTKLDRPQALAIESWTISSDSTVHLEIFINSTLVSGGTDRIPTMLHTSKHVPGTSKIIIKDASVSAISDSITNATEIRSLFISANSVYHESFQGALLLAPDATISVRATGVTGNKVRVMVNAYWSAEPE